MRSTFLSTFVLGALCPACVLGEETPAPVDDEPVGVDEQRITDDAVGVSVVVPASWQIFKDPALFETHGFFLRSDDAPHGHALARISRAYGAKASEVDALVAKKLARYADAGAERTEITLPDGRTAIAITHLPGTDPYTAVFVTDGDRVYEIGLWSDEPGLDERGRAVLGKLRFRAPQKQIDELGLLPADQMVFGEPPQELAEASARAAQQRSATVHAAAQEDPAFAQAMQRETLEEPTPSGTTAADGCGFTAPASLYWQLQWDETNTFYSGSYYNLRDRPGWSAMSGNYGSWWGTNYHVGLCYTQRTNQYYANDWPAQRWANAYAAFSGTVEWAGWGTDGFATLGRYVVVRNGAYRSTTAHLSAIRAGVKWGAWIDGYSQIIGWAGDTGGPWAPHLHARISWGESLTWNGQPYGGQSVRPNRLRCFDCNDFDLDAPGAGGYYNSFFHGRWMRY